MKTPLVSVVLPVWNPDPVLLKQALESLLAQTIQDFEIVVSEEPSPRTAHGVLAALADPRIVHIFHEKRTSLVEQIRRAHAHCRSDLVARMDGDDICHPARLEKQVAFMVAHPDVSVCGTQLEVIDGNGRTLGYRRYPTSHEAIISAMRRYSPLAQPSVIYRKAEILRVGDYQYTSYVSNEDYELWCRLATRGAVFANLDEALVRYRIHGGGLKANNVHKILRGTIAVKRHYWGRAFTVRDRVRLWAEIALLALPPRLILWLFFKSQLRTKL